MAISTGFRFEKSIRIIFGFMLLTSLLCILPGCASSPSTSDSAKISSVLYTIQPLKVGEFNPIDIKLDLNSDRYVTPKNDGYGVYRIDGTNICFHASYSNKERCIDYEIHYKDWSEGDSWEIISYDGSKVVVVVKKITK